MIPRDPPVRIEKDQRWRLPTGNILRVTQVRTDCWNYACGHYEINGQPVGDPVTLAVNFLVKYGRLLS